MDSNNGAICGSGSGDFEIAPASEPSRGRIGRLLSLTVNCLILSRMVTALLLAASGVAACGPDVRSTKQQENRVAGMTIEEVLKRHTERLMSIPGVVGTAIGECAGSPCILVLVVKKTPDLMKKIPSTLEGFPVGVEETGAIRPLDTGRLPKSR